MKCQPIFVATVLAAALSSPALAQKKYDPGATDSEIRLGNTNPYSGPASAYGTIAKSIAAYFKMVNDQGGINGRKVNFISYDDSYSPPKTVEMVRKLVEQDNVLFVFQTLGTPSNTAIHKYMNMKKVPQMHVATGATKWNDPKNFPWTMGWQPNYQSEGRAYAAHILQTKPDAKIGVLLQNDDYGKDYLKGFKDGLGDKAKSMIVAEVSYEVSDPTVDSQIVQLQASGANVFFNITTPKFAAQAIRKAYDIGWKPVHYLNNVSNSVGSVLTPAGLEKSIGIISSAYLKDATDQRWANDAAIGKWREFMKKYYPDGDQADIFNVYGYTVGSTVAEVLKKCGDNLTRENVMKQAASLQGFRVDTMLPGITITTGGDDFAPIESVQLERFNGKQWELFGEVMGK
jgi:branched-chain amino acid transport system substrate-binding protein